MASQTPNHRQQRYGTCQSQKISRRLPSPFITEEEIPSNILQILKNNNFFRRIDINCIYQNTCYKAPLSSKFFIINILINKKKEGIIVL